MGLKLSSYYYNATHTKKSVYCNRKTLFMTVYHIQLAKSTLKLLKFMNAYVYKIYKIFFDTYDIMLFMYSGIL